MLLLSLAGLKQDMNPLLVSDVLRAIVFFLPGESIARLYATNHRSLQKLLLSPFVVTSWTFGVGLGGTYNKFEHKLLFSSRSISHVTFVAQRTPAKHLTCYPSIRSSVFILDMNLQTISSMAGLVTLLVGFVAEITLLDTRSAKSFVWTIFSPS